MLFSKKYAVFYRDIPDELVTFMVADGNISYAKDGIKKFEDGHKCPRLSVVVNPTGNKDTDKSRLKRLNDLLDRLQKLYKIVGYST